MLDPKEDRTLISDHLVELDWDAYFVEFQSVHGGEPVMYEPLKRLLFRDGWTYSATDTKGPEWPPPENEHVRAELIREYWRLRRTLLRTKVESLKGRTADLTELQRLRSAPLQRKVVTTDDSGRRLITTKTIDIGMMEATVQLLEAAIEECNSHLR